MTVNQLSVDEQVIAIVAKQFRVCKSDLSRATAFVEDLGGDSLDSLELVQELEEELDVNIYDGEVEGLKTVGNVIDLVVTRLTPR